MGRKIPGRKHHGVKDPVVQQQKRLASLKGKINAPPKNPDEQEMPKQLTKLMELCKKVKSGEISDKRKRKKKKAFPVTSAPKNPYAAYEPVSTHSKGRPEKPVPVFTQGSNENTHAFLQRVNRTVNDVLQESKFEDKYGVTVERDPETGNVHFRKERRNEKTDLDNLRPKTRNSSRNKKALKNKNDKEKESTDAEKNSIKKIRKEVANTQKDFNKFQDTIKFGEVVHSPPNISVLPRYAKKSEDTSRPGQKNLLLKQNLVSSKKSLVKKRKQKECAEVKSAPAKKSQTKIDTKGKRKDLPLRMRHQLEAEQKSAMDAYRLLKNKKISDIFLKTKG